VNGGILPLLNSTADEEPPEMESDSHDEAGTNQQDTDGASDGATSDDAGTGDDGTADREPSPIDPAALSESQRETLRAIHRQPDATQAEIASELGVVRATVSNRLTDLDEFEWYDRQAFVERLFDEPAGDEASRRDDRPDRLTATADARSDPVDAPAGDDGAGRPADKTLLDLTDRLATIEASVASLEDAVEHNSTNPDAKARQDANEQNSSSPGLTSPRDDAVGTSSDEPSIAVAPEDALEQREDDADPELLYKGIEAIVAADGLADREAIALIRRLL